MNYRMLLTMLLAATGIQAAGDVYVIPYNTSVDEKGNLQIRILLYKENDESKFTAYTTDSRNFSQSYGPRALKNPTPDNNVIEEVANITRRVFGIVDPANITDQALADTGKDLATSTDYLQSRSKGLSSGSKIALIPVPYIPTTEINKAAPFDGKEYKLGWFFLNEAPAMEPQLRTALYKEDRERFAPEIVYLPRYASNNITTFLLQNRTNQFIMTLTKNLWGGTEDYYTTNVLKTFGKAVNRNDAFTINDSSMKYYTYYARDRNDEVFVSFNLDDAAKKDFETYVTSKTDEDYTTHTEKPRSIAYVAGGTLYAWAGLTDKDAPIVTTDKKSLNDLQNLTRLQSPEGQAFIGSMVPADQRPKAAPTPVVRPQPNKNNNQGQGQQAAANSAGLAAALSTLAEKLNDLATLLGSQQTYHGEGEWPPTHGTGEGEWPPKK